MAHNTLDRDKFSTNTLFKAASHVLDENVLSSVYLYFRTEDGKYRVLYPSLPNLSGQRPALQFSRIRRAGVKGRHTHL